MKNEREDEINRVKHQLDELLKVSKELVDVDFSFGPEIGDIRARYKNGIDAMNLINATRRLVSEIENQDQ